MLKNEDLMQDQQRMNIQKTDSVHSPSMEAHRILKKVPEDHPTDLPASKEGIFLDH